MTLLAAPAKLTWYLEVTGRRSNGLHELRAEMVTVDFADELEIDDGADYLRVEGPFPSVSTGPDNLVAGALRLVGRRAGVKLRKVIPPGGGLGGGSADAAAVLRWAGGVTNERALSLGADVPFCQLGGRALVEGVGERLTPLSYEARDLTLVLLPFGLDTASVYRAYDERGDEGRPAGARNDLEGAARRVEPRLARAMDWLSATLGVPVHLAGSGSTLFVEGHLRVGAPPWDVEGPDGSVHFRQTTSTPRV